MQNWNSKEQGHHSRLSAGFSLIEALIVMAIIGILTAIAYPSYGAYVQKTRRADGQLALMQAVQSLERCKAIKYSYTGCTLSTANSTSPEGHYTLTLASTASSFTLTASGAGAQASDPDCDTLTINNKGSRTPGDSSKQCWSG